MIVQQSPGKNSSICILCQMTQAGYKIFAVCLIVRDIPLFNTAYHNVMQSTGGVQSCLSWHLISLRIRLLPYHQLFYFEGNLFKF
jgi:hypothetical protein